MHYYNGAKVALRRMVGWTGESDDDRFDHMDVWMVECLAWNDSDNSISQENDDNNLFCKTLILQMTREINDLAM